DILEWDPNDSVVRGKYDQVQFEVRKAKRPNYYDIIGCSRVASVPEIKRLYKDRARELHPDKHDSEEVKAWAEERFKLLGEALGILTDELMRSLYDEGHDKESIQERVDAANRAARKDPREEQRRGGHHHQHDH
ncbi:hypothetical protein CYMTET_27705, partial [Cymbomonas tetramitiformis]